MTEPLQGHWVQQALAQHERSLLRFAASLVGPAAAPDIVQEVFLELCQQSRDAVEGHLSAWLFRVTRHRCLDFLRSGKRHAHLAEEDQMEAPDSGPASKLERRQALLRLKRVIDALPERQKQAVLLKFDADLTYEQIAAAMGTSVTNVGVTLHTALKRLRDELRHEEKQLGGAL